MTVTDYGLVGGTWLFQGLGDYQITNQCPVWLSTGVTLQANNILGSKIVGYEANALDPAHPEWNSLLPSPITTILSGVDANLNGINAQGIWYTSSASGATVVSVGTIQWAWGLDGFTVESPSYRNSTNADSGIQVFTKNLIAHCLDKVNMIADLADGIYEIRSVSAYPQNFMTTTSTPGGPVGISGNGTWTTNSQAKWIITHFTGFHTSKPNFGPYKAAADEWYTIQNAQNGQRLIVGSSGNINGPLMLIGNSNGNWGQALDDTQMMWRIWRYTNYTFSTPVYIFQCVSNGQLLIVSSGGVQNGPVGVYGNYNGGWGEAESNPQKLWSLNKVG